jgi:hypothetical protein
MQPNLQSYKVLCINGSFHDPEQAKSPFFGILRSAGLSLYSNTYPGKIPGMRAMDIGLRFGPITHAKDLSIGSSPD